MRPPTRGRKAVAIAIVFAVLSPHPQLLQYLLLAAGAFALETLFALLNFLGVQSTWRDTVQGAIIILAVAAGTQTWKRRRRGRTAAAQEPRRAIAAPPTPGTDEEGT